MQNLRSYKYRIYPNKSQRDYLEINFGTVRFFWNQLVANFLSCGSENFRKNLSEKELKIEFPWMKDAISYALQQKRMDFQETLKQHFSKSRKKKLGKPKFKKKGVSVDSFRIPGQALGYSKSVNFERGTIKIPKMTPIKMSIDRKFKGELRSVTISKNNIGEFYASILVSEDIEFLPKSYKDIGIDLGLNDLLILSDGTKFQNPKYYRENQAKLRKLQKNLSRKIKGSSKYKKAKLKVGKHHKKITRLRDWYYHNISLYLVKTFDSIILEDLNVSGMLKNRKLSKSISDASWSTLVNMIAYKCRWYGKEIIQVGRFFASSKTCSSCGHIVESLPLSIREWECPSCNKRHDRDVNAARTIFKEGMMKNHGLLSEELPEYTHGEEIRPEWFFNQEGKLR